PRSSRRVALPAWTRVRMRDRRRSTPAASSRRTGATPCDLPLLTSVHRGRERTERAPAVRHGMLLLRSHLRKRAAVALQRYEHRVVTESALAARQSGDETLDVAPGHDLARVGPARDGDGGEPGGA